MTGLADVEAAAPLLAGAFTLVRGAASLVLDLRDNMWDEPEHVAVRITQVADAADAVHVFERQRRGTAQLQTFWYTSSMSPSTPTTTFASVHGGTALGCRPLPLVKVSLSMLSPS